MRIVVDALGAPAQSGGMRLYAAELVRAWAGRFEEDELHVVGYPWWLDEALEDSNVTVHPVRETTTTRVLGQWGYTPLVARRLRADAVLSVSHVVSPLCGAPRVCVVHDWRHLAKPHEFSRGQRIYRRAWVWSVTHSDFAIQISEKTARETERISPRARPVVVANGGDHAARWRRVEDVDGHPRRVVTFGHQTNKRPELLINALPLLADPDSVLVVLGAKGDYAAELARLVQNLGLTGRVHLPGFVDEATYQEIVQTADVVALVSSDEGFGLPVAEARYFGIPVVTTADSGLGEIHSRLIECDPEPSALAGALTVALDQGRGHPGNEASSWQETASGIRRVVQMAVDNGARHGKG